MILSIKKYLLNGVIALLICSTTNAKTTVVGFNDWNVQDLEMSSTTESTTTTQSFDLGPWSSNNHTCDIATHTHELSVTNHKDYDTYVATCTNNETKDCISETAIVYRDDLSSTPVESSSNDMSNSNSTTTSLNNDNWKEELARDQAIEAHQQANSTQTTQNEPTRLSNAQIAERRKAVKLHKIANEYSWQINNKKISSAAISPKTVDFKINKSSNTIAALKLPTVQEQLQLLKKNIKTFRTKDVVGRKNFKFVQKEIIFIDKSLSGEITHLLEQVLYADPNTAYTALNELKALSPYDREYQFLVPLFSSDMEERFIHSVIGEDIIKIAEKDFFSRQDCIPYYANENEQKIIQNYREKCILLQQKGDIAALYNECKNICFSIVINNDKNDFTTNACLAIIENSLHNPITTVLSNIRQTPSLEKARSELINLEMQILDQTQKINITQTDQIKQWTIDHYGFDILDAAQKCYQSRTDYIATLENQSLFSDKIRTIVNNIEHKDLPNAHAELVHFNKQIDKVLKDRNITDSIAQKEYIKKTFGKDVLELTHKTYEARADHKQLVESFMAIDVNQAAVKILENNNSYESVAYEMNDLAQHVFGNARLCNLNNLPKIEAHVYDSIDAMRIAQDHPTFIINLSMVNRILGDIQQLTHAILTGTHPVLERSSELLIIGFSEFFKGLNPVTQAENMGHLVYDLGSLLKKGGVALWNDPIAVMNNGVTTTFTLLELIINTACFTSDITVGKLYLSPEQYKQRNDAFCAMMEPLQGVPGDQCAAFIGRCIADVLFLEGIGSAYTVLKEIDVLEKLGESSAAVARALKKGFDTHLADNPIAVTAEGVVFQMSNDLKNLGETTKEIINSSKALLENAATALIDTAFFTDLKLIGDNLWKSPGGLIYGYDRKFGNTLNHVLSHMTPNAIKQNHTVFSVSKDKIVQLIDEAWAIRGNPLASDPRAHIIDMKKIIGTNGETAIRVVLKEPGTCEIITAYPVKI